MNENTTLERKESKVQEVVRKPNVIKYMIQSVFGLAVLIFAAVQIVIYPDRPNQLWVGMICTIVGIFLPHPTPDNNNDLPTSLLDNDVGDNSNHRIDALINSTFKTRLRTHEITKSPMRNSPRRLPQAIAARDTIR